MSSSCAHNSLHVLTPVSGLVITYHSSYVIAPGEAVQLRVSVKEGTEFGVVAKIGSFSYDVPMRLVYSLSFVMRVWRLIVSVSEKKKKLKTIFIMNV